MKHNIKWFRPIDLFQGSRYCGKFLPEIIDFEPGAKEANLYGRYAPLEEEGKFGTPVHAAIFVVLDREIYEPVDIEISAWKCWKFYDT